MRQENAAPRRSVFRYVTLSGAALLGVVLLLGGVGVAALTGLMISERTFARQDLPLYQVAGRLSTNAAALAALSARQATATTPAELATLADRIASRDRMISADLGELGTLGLPEAPLDRLRAAHQSIVNSALRLDALHQEVAALRRAGASDSDLMPLRRRLAGLLQHQEVVASEMETLLGGLVADADTRLRAAQDRIRARLRQLLALMVGASLLTGLILGGLYLGLRRHLLDRLRHLTAALDDWRQGGRPALALDGPDDELAQMARTLDGLVEMVGRQTAELQLKAITDPLTGILNRRGLADHGADLLRLAQRYGTPVAVLVGDIDHFKHVNDTFGHATGDQVLRRVAVLWQGALREVDLFARMGGEEFACVMPHTDGNGARQLAERIRATLAAAPLAEASGVPISCTISIGVAEAHADDDLTTLLSRADAALYHAKTAGRDRVIVAAE